MNHATLSSTPDSAEPAHESTLPAAGRHLDMLAIRRQVSAALFPDSATPQQLGRFRILEHIGTGAMGSVYAAWDPDLERRVAIKVLNWRTEATGRMKREAKALARLTHPNVITVHEVGTVEEQVFVAMEFVRGQTLREVAGDAQWRKVVDLYLQAGDGLAAAHAAGLVHRDFKPDNAMVGDDGRVRVLDFGLARPTHEVIEAGASVPVAEMPVDQLTRTGSILGTPAYMAPEQLAGAIADARSDQFAWCVSLCEALSGRRPWDAETLGELATRVRTQSPELVLPAGVPARLRRVLKRGLEVDPDARWQDMQMLLHEARRALLPQTAWIGLIGAASVIFLALVGVAGGVAYISLDAAAVREEVCTAGQERMLAAWNDETRARIRALDVHENQSSEFIAGLDEWTGRWTEVSDSVCAGSDPEALKCVADLSIQAGAMVAAFEAEPFSRFDARDYDWPLTDPHLCRTGGPGTGLPPVPAEVAVEVVSLRIAIERELFRHAGHLYYSDTEVVSPLPAAEATGYPPVIAEAHFARALQLRYENDFRGTEREAKAALEVAQAVGHRLIVAKARLLLAEIGAEAGIDERTLATLVEEAGRAIGQLPQERGAVVASLRRDVALIVTGQERFAELGVRSFEAALPPLPERSNARAETLTEFAEHLEQLGREEEAMQRRLQVIEIRVEQMQTRGSASARDRTRSRLAHALANAGRYAEAIEQVREGLEDPDVDHGPRSEAIRHSWIGHWSLILGRTDAAEEAYKRLEEMRLAQKAAEGEQSVAIEADLGLARAALQRGDKKAIVRHLTRGAPLSVMLGQLLVWTQLALGDVEAAQRIARKTFDSELRRFDAEDEQLHDSMFALAATLISAKREQEAVVLLDHDHVLERDASGLSKRLLALALRRLDRDHARADELHEAGEQGAKAERAKKARNRIALDMFDLIDDALTKI